MKCSICNCGLGSSADDTREELLMNNDAWVDDNGNLACEDCANEQ